MQPEEFEPTIKDQPTVVSGDTDATVVDQPDQPNLTETDEELARILADPQDVDYDLDYDLDLGLGPDVLLEPIAAAVPRNFADEDMKSSHDRYRTVFGSASLGTEEELSGVKIEMAVAASSIIGVVRRSDSDGVLVEITRDIGEEGEELGRYTIELRTTPTEFLDTDGWDRRVHALAYAVYQIENSAGGVIDAAAYGQYEIELFNVDHSIFFPGAHKVPSADRQATVAVQASELGFDTMAMAGMNRRQGHIHEHVSLPWYIEAFVYDDIAAGMGARGRFAYAFLLSAVAKLAAIWAADRKQFGLVNRLSVKNAWGVRPRTPPIRILETLTPEVRALVWHAVQTRPSPAQDWVGTPMLSGDLAGIAATWNLAKAQILSGLPMGGHNPPEAYVGSSDAMQFEYRTAPKEYADHFWDPERKGLEYDFDK